MLNNFIFSPDFDWFHLKHSEALHYRGKEEEEEIIITIRTWHEDFDNGNDGFEKRSEPTFFTNTFTAVNEMGEAFCKYVWKNFLFLSKF